MKHYPHYNASDEIKTGLIVSLENQFVPVMSIDTSLSLIEFTEEGIIGFNDQHVLYTPSGNPGVVWNKVYYNYPYLKTVPGNFWYELDEFQYIKVECYKSDDVVSFYENLIDTFYQNFPTLKRLISEFPESKGNIIRHYALDVMDNESHMKVYTLSNEDHGQRDLVKASVEDIKSLCFSNIQGEFGMNTLHEFRESLK